MQISTHTNLTVRKIMEVMRSQKAGFSLKTSQTTHETNDHEMHASIVKERAFANNISVSILLNRLMVVKVLEMRHSFLYFVGTHFRIFVRKFLVHSRTA